MAARRLVYLSDVHIGANAPVNWYQQSVHEPYLAAVLNYIRDTASEIDELIVLGDLFDLWTYLPSHKPATLRDVVLANPKIFGGPGQVGLLQQVLGLLKVPVTFMNGNHDMTVTQAELDTIQGHDGSTMQREDAMAYTPPGGGGHVVCTHGHIFSVFCAPFSEGLLGTLPIGYFVTRLAAQWDQKQIDENPHKYRTVADMPNTGTPTGWSFSEKNVDRILDGLWHGQEGLAELLFDVIIGDSADKQRQQTFIMPDNTAPNAYDLARTTYKDSYDDWVAWADRYPGIFGDPTLDPPGPVALGEVDFDDSLLHFAKILGESYKVVVMGHTHAPEDEIDTPRYIHPFEKSLYVDCGFNCPSKPDMFRPGNPKHPTFVELEVDEQAKLCTAKVRYVQRLLGGGCGVAPDPLEQQEIALQGPPTIPLIRE